MKRKHTLMSLLLLFSMVLAACSNNASVHVAEVVDFDKQPDLSIYYVEEEAPEEDIVELKPTLEYIDTAYMMKLKAAAGEISSERKTYEQYPVEWDFVLVDSRPPNVFAEGHINGAINIPDAQFDQLAKDRLPKDKNTLLIFYCGGMTCHLSANSAEKAEALGYKNVQVYQEGVPAWKKAGNYLTVTSEYVKESIMEATVTNDDRQPVVILDARPYTKYFEAHIPNSVYADDSSYAKKFIGTAPQAKETEIIIYCGGFSCHKSHVVAQQLVNSGYTNIKVYSGGLPEWSAQKLPTFGTDAPKTAFNVSEGKVDRSLTSDAFQKKLSEKNVTVLDVRSYDEVKKGSIKGSINIPDGDIHADPKQIADQLPKDKNATIVIHCASGARAAGVVNKIADLGYPNTFYLNNAIQIAEDGTYTFN